MKKLKKWSGIWFVVAILTWQNCAVQAEEPSIDGAYVFDAKRSDDIIAAIDAGMKNVPPMYREGAREDLKRRQFAYQHIKITHDSKDVSISYDKKKPFLMPINGAPLKWTREEDGQVLDVSSRWSGNRFVQTFGTTKGARENDFALSADGTMILTVVNTSPVFGTPIKYRLFYRREAE